MPQKLRAATVRERPRWCNHQIRVIQKNQANVDFFGVSGTVVVQWSLANARGSEVVILST
jgi:hypothetical protein